MSDDLLQGSGDAIANGAPEAELDPNEDLDKLMEMLGKLPEFAGVNKEMLLKNLGQGKARPPISDVSNPWVEVLVLFTMISLVILLLAFIGYRLYEKTASKEKRRELKKARKEQKKKK